MYGITLCFGYWQMTSIHHCCCCYFSVAHSYPTLCNSMDCSTPGFPILNHLPELSQIHVHWFSDAMQTSHPLSSPPPPAFSLHSIRVISNESALLIRWPNIGASALAPGLPMNIQGWFPLVLTGWISLQSKELSRVFSDTTVQKHPFFGTQLSLWSDLHIEKAETLLYYQSPA